MDNEYHYSLAAKGIKPAAASPLTQDQLVASVQVCNTSDKESLSLSVTTAGTAVSVERLSLPWAESALQCMPGWCAVWCCASSWGH